MARCPNCGTEVSADARFCPHCGANLPRRPSAQEQPPLPFSPWGPPPLQPAGAGATARAEPVVGKPLSTTQVAIAVGAILLFLAFVIFLGRGLTGGGGTSQNADNTRNLPVVGMKGEAVPMGNTAWGVAFTDQMNEVNNRPPQNGQFYAVGIVVGNRGSSELPLSVDSVGLFDAESGRRYKPVITAWGTPEQIGAGQYRTRMSLPPQEAIAGLVVFDVPQLAKPRLLVRDLSTSSADFTGMIDLTREKASGE